MPQTGSDSFFIGRIWLREEEPFVFGFMKQETGSKVLFFHPDGRTIQSLQNLFFHTEEWVISGVDFCFMTWLLPFSLLRIPGERRNASPENQL